MDIRLRREAVLRAITLKSYIAHRKQIKKLKLKLVELFSRTHEFKNGKRINLTKQRKISLGNKLIKSHFKELKVNKDINNQDKKL